MNNFLDYLSVQAQQLADKFYDGEITGELPDRTLQALELIVADVWRIDTAEQRLQILYWISAGNTDTLGGTSNVR